MSLTWTLHDKRLLSGSQFDPTIRNWDTSTWKQVSNPRRGHTGYINAITVNFTDTLVATATYTQSYSPLATLRSTNHRHIQVFPTSVLCHLVRGWQIRLLSGGEDMKMWEWAVPKDAIWRGAKVQVSEASLPSFAVSSLSYSSFRTTHARVLPDTSRCRMDCSSSFCQRI
ncbi:hypothetical protein K503DRAFT_166534 [Rhizopogon vinicolor AM-OR11-026]|uniref:WD40 repeat-like protein n=1 Tax=Rhizopogon vinicolor AM-OR11-026 TaxID=1314800 RepID=A0A1B7N0H0_9AGAM|nr:hypothetical protein K503DRAFT_166534 [Rhizopogon vinicolor AM-OR11-026]